MSEKEWKRIKSAVKNNKENLKDDLALSVLKSAKDFQESLVEDEKMFEEFYDLFRKMMLLLYKKSDKILVPEVYLVLYILQNSKDFFVQTAKKDAECMTQVFCTAIEKAISIV